MATWQDIVQAPDDGRTYEVIDAELEAQPRPLPGHSRAQTVLTGDLSGPFDRGQGGPGGWWDIVAPDMAAWRERLPAFPETRPITSRPDCVCEVLSPSNPRRDRIVKANLYLHSKIPYYWIIDLDARILEAYTNRENGWLRLGAWADGDRPRVEPFDAIELEVAGLFPPLSPAGGD